MAEMIFDVYADVGPSFESVKAETKEEIKELLSSGQLDPETHTILLNEYLMMIDGTNFKDLREYSRNKLIVMGVKKPETDEEKAMLEQSQQQQEPTVEEQAEMKRADADMAHAQASILKEQNIAARLNLDTGKAQLDDQGKQRKQMSDDQVNYAKITQAQQKLDDDAFDKQTGRAIELQKLELEAGRDLNAELMNNMLVFDPSTGDFA